MYMRVICPKCGGCLNYVLDDLFSMFDAGDVWEWGCRKCGGFSCPHLKCVYCGLVFNVNNR